MTILPEGEELSGVPKIREQDIGYIEFVDGEHMFFYRIKNNIFKWIFTIDDPNLLHRLIIEDIIPEIKVKKNNWSLNNLSSLTSKGIKSGYNIKVHDYVFTYKDLIALANVIKKIPNFKDWKKLG